MIERVVSLAVGTVLLGAVCFIMANPGRSARIIQDYYAQQVARETARGWLGRPLLVPGKVASLVLLLLLMMVALTIGIYALFIGVTG